MTLREQLIRDEGIRLKPYKDMVGKWTIGAGRNLSDKGISLSEVEVLLDNDIRDTMIQVGERLPWVIDLDEARRGVIYNMAFNLGVGGLLGFRKTLEHVQQGEWALAAIEMLNSQWAQQVGPRAHRLARQMETGIWQ